jgi:AraC-like DNA-binding protein
VTEVEKSAQLSARFVRPFVKMFSKRPDFDERCLRLKLDLTNLGPDERVRTDVAFQSLEELVKVTEDPNLGLRAGKMISAGASGPLEFVLHSAETLGEALQLASHHSRLYDEALDLRIELEGERAIVRLDSRIPRPKPAADFTTASWYANLLASPLTGAKGVECWFSHAAPADTREYENTFGPHAVRFSARCCGFAFDRKYLDAPLDGANARVHAILRAQVELMAAEMPSTRSIAAQVRELIASQLPRTKPNAQHVASVLRMSRRTFVRRLEEEGTTFTRELESVRRRLALKYVASADVPLTEISQLLGFSEVSAFHRAFKRWTEKTPIQYRHERNGEHRQNGHSGGGSGAVS